MPATCQGGVATGGRSVPGVAAIVAEAAGAVVADGGGPSHRHSSSAALGNQDPSWAEFI